jgi:hypothetical protein
MARPIGIRVFKGDEQVDVQIFDRDIIKIGRLSSAHLRLEDPKVSRIHAVIDIAAGSDEVSIIDMGSAEGTEVNGEKVSRARLSNGDEITLGESRLVVLLDQADIGALVSEHQSLLDDGDLSIEPDADEAFAAVKTGHFEVGPPPGEQPAEEPADLNTAMREELADLEPPAEQSSVFETNDELSDAIAESAETPEADEPVFKFEPPEGAEPEPAPAAAPPQVAAQPPPPAQGMVVGASPLPPIPEDPITPENRFLEVALRWSGDVIEVKRVREVPKFSIGSAEDDDLFVPVEEFANASSFDLVTGGESGQWMLNFTPKMGGTVKRGGQTQPLSEAGRGSIAVTDDMEVTLELGYFTLEIKNASRSRAIPLPPLLDTFFINTVLVTLFASASMMATLLLFPTDGLNDDDDLMTNTSQFQTLILKKKEPDKSFLDRLKGKNAKGKAAKKDKGSSGDKKSKNKDGKRTFKKKDKPTDEDIVASKMAQLFGSKGGAAQIFGADMGGSELQNLLGNMSGSKAAAAFGEGGLSFRGSGPGGGGTGDATFGLGNVGTRGRGSGDSGYGTGEGGLGKKRSRDVSISSGRPVITGSLDKEIIRRIVREHQGEIRYCYTKELTRNPGLGGKVIMKWVISGSGKVVKASVAENQMGSSSVGSCLASRIKRWRFPKPKGGGIVVVSYPFVFKRGG